MTCEEVADNLDMYVLDALDHDLAAQVAQHAAACPACQRTLNQAQQLATCLALAIPPRRPSAGLRERILSLAAREVATPATVGGRSPRSLAARTVFRLATFGLAATMTVVLIAAGWWIGSIQIRLAEQAEMLRNLQMQMSERDMLITLMASPDVNERELAGTPEAPNAGARIYLHPSTTEAALITWNLPSLPTDKAYQLWLIDPTGERASGGVFQVTANGTGLLLVRAPRPLSTYRGLGVTVEPAGGSPGPTGVRVLGGSL